MAPAQKAGWLYQLLPFVEQEGAWKGVGAGPQGSLTQLEWTVEKGATALGTAVPIFYCPSRRNPKADPSSDTGPTQFWCGTQDVGRLGRVSPIGKNDYAGSSLQNNNSAVAIALPDDMFGGGSASLRLTRSGLRGLGWQGLGAIARSRSINNASYETAHSGKEQTKLEQLVSFGKMIDGSSYTMLAGEKQMTLESIGGRPGNDNDGFLSGWDQDVMCRTDRLPLPDANRIALEQRFGSSHPAGVNVVLCDTSVRFINYNVDLEVWARMGHRADGYAYELP